MKETEIVKILEQAESIDGMLEQYTPKGMRLELNTHSTATHCYIYLTAEEGVPDLLIWYKTNWCSSIYTFNEEGKTIGIQKGCEFIQPKLDAFFSVVELAIEDAKTIADVNKLNRSIEEENKLNVLTDQYRKIFS